MPTFWNEADRQHLVSRLRRLTPEASHRWGRLDAPGVLAHLHESARMALGELEIKPRRLPIRHPPLKQLIIFVFPFPKGAPTAPELICRQATDWPAEMKALESAFDRLVARDPAGPWRDHPAFGRMTRRAWGVLIYRHTDHHLRQFGV